MGITKWVDDYEGWGQILKSPGLQALIQEKTARVQEAAGGAAAGFHMQVGTSAKGDRVTGRVWTASHAARVAEATDRVLTKAFGSIA